jgi:membrane fusion protein
VVTRDELAIREADAADQRARLDAVRREASAMEREAGTAQREIDAMAQRMQAQRSELERGILAARQELTEIDARRVMVVTATTAGRVSLVQAEPGQAVDAQRPLIHVVPDGANLVARLLVPSRAAGFIKPGMRVMLRYDSYPYQKFGQQQASVLSVSQVAVPASELNGLDAPLAGAPAGSPAESLFAVTVALPSRTLGDATRPLQAGMRLEADLMQETRRLYEWVLEPLFAARARVAA